MCVHHVLVYLFIASACVFHSCRVWSMVICELEDISDDVVHKIQVMLFEYELHLQQCKAKRVYFYSSLQQQFQVLAITLNAR